MGGGFHSEWPSLHSLPPTHSTPAANHSEGAVRLASCDIPSALVDSAPNRLAAALHFSLLSASSFRREAQPEPG